MITLKIFNKDEFSHKEKGRFSADGKLISSNTGTYGCSSGEHIIKDLPFRMEMEGSEELDKNNYEDWIKQYLIETIPLYGEGNLKIENFDKDLMIEIYEGMTAKQAMEEDLASCR